MTAGAHLLARRAHALASERRPRRTVRRYITTTPDHEAARRIAGEHRPALVTPTPDGWYRVEAFEEVAR